MVNQIHAMAVGFYGFLNNLGYTHPVHTVLVPVPIGLVTAALLFVLAGLLFRRVDLGYAARHCLILALLSLFPAVFLGLMDWQSFYGGAWLFPFQVKMGLGAVLFALLIWGVIGSRRPERQRRVLLISLLSFFSVVFIGYFGGQIIFGGRAPASEMNRLGGAVFRNHCSGCHPYGANILVSENTVVHSGLLKSEPAFVAWIRNPKPPMPPYPPSAISGPHARALFEYLAEVWGGEEPWEQPQPPASPQDPPEPKTPRPAQPSPGAERLQPPRIEWISSSASSPP